MFVDLKCLQNMLFLILHDLQILVDFIGELLYNLICSYFRSFPTWSTSGQYVWIFKNLSS